MSMTYKLAILSGGAPNTFRHMQLAIEQGAIKDTEIVVIATNHHKAPISGVARTFGIPCRYLDGVNAIVLDKQACQLFQEHRTDIVLLMGYGKKVGTKLLAAFPNRILNAHSGPLPRFGGKGMMQERTQEAVLAAGITHSGPTIHMVDEEYDHGQILAHWPVKIRAEDTAAALNARCNLVGRELYVRAIQDFVYRLGHPNDFS